MITDVLKAEGVVDLIALSGDMVSGYAWDGTDGWYSKMWAASTQTDATVLPAAHTVTQPPEGAQAAAQTANQHACTPLLRS